MNHYSEQYLTQLSDLYLGKTIKIIHLDDKYEGPLYAGKTGKVAYIDSQGQLHGDWGGLAIAPEVDTFVVLD
jgi:hypothetical protein